jgi:hypothetical protein
MWLFRRGDWLVVVSCGGLSIVIVGVRLWLSNFFEEIYARLSITFTERKGTTRSIRCERQKMLEKQERSETCEKR